jgi:hypothetical protein
MRARTFVLSSAAALVVAFVSDVSAQSAQEDYGKLCSSCHGASFRLPSGGSIATREAAALASSIRQG